MQIEDYKSNSHRSKEDQNDIHEKKLETVAVGKVKKKNGFIKAKEAIISEDAQNVKEYIIRDVIVPAAKDLINKIVTNSISMILFGDTSHATKSGTGSSAYRYSYNSCYSGNSSQKSNNSNSRTVYDYDDIIFESRGAAEQVLSSMDDLIERYNMVSVADFYDLSGVTGQYTDNKYGWTNLRDASIIRMSDGYMIKFPKAIPLN